MVHGFGGLGWLWIVVMVVVCGGSWLSVMGSSLLWVFWWWWIPTYGGFVVSLSFFI